MVNDYQQPSRTFVKNDDHAMTAEADIPRSKFVGTWTRNTTFDQGFLVPFMVDEVLPGDQLNYKATQYLRMATPVFPIFDNLKIDTFYFFVPNRIVWDAWRQFMGENRSTAGAAPANWTVPQIASPLGGFSINSLADHLGVYAGTSGAQVGPGQQISVNHLPFRAYTLIFNEWFRDQNLQAPVALDISSANVVGDPPLLRRNKMHDYFTSCLPWPEKQTAATAPLNGRIPISGIGFTGGQGWNSTSPTLYQPDGVVGQFSTFTAVPDYGTMYVRGANFFGINHPDVYVDLTNGAGLDLRTLRSSMLVQQLYEKDARGGTRYTELITQHFGVMSPDSRLQRPEYIGGGSQMMQMTPIAQTALGASPLGTLGAAGTSIGESSASYAAQEHGFIIGLISVQSELSYSQGIPRMFSRNTRLDYYWPSLAELGEQPVLRQELYATGVAADDRRVFGYQERWHEYRTRYSEVTGRFRPTASLPLDAWHLSQRFTLPPTLNQEFVQDVAPMARILATTAPDPGQEFLANILIQRTAVRPLPMFSTPAQLGRF